jgi:hypothetical protein
MSFRAGARVHEPRVDDVRRVVGHDAPVMAPLREARPLIHPQKVHHVREVGRRWCHDQGRALPTSLIERYHESHPNVSVSELDTETRAGG